MQLASRHPGGLSRTASPLWTLWMGCELILHRHNITQGIYTTMPGRRSRVHFISEESARRRELVTLLSIRTLVSTRPWGFALIGSTSRPVARMLFCYRQAAHHLVTQTWLIGILGYDNWNYHAPHFLLNCCFVGPSISYLNPLSIVRQSIEVHQSYVI